MKVEKKKPNPSTVKRNKKRKINFLQMKLSSSSPKPNLPPPKVPPTNQPLHSPPPSKPPPSNKPLYTSIPSLPDPNTLPQSPPEKINLFLCSACKKSFKTKHELVNHYKNTQTLSHIKLASLATCEDASASIPSSATYTPCMSISCDSKFPSWSEMMKHVQRQHS